MFINDVYFVLNMRTNILSIGQLIEKGYHVSMSGRMLLKDA